MLLQFLPAFSPACLALTLLRLAVVWPRNLER